MSLTLRQAATAVGRSKPTLARAIQKGRLSAGRNPDGSYSIDESELYRVYAPATPPAGSATGTVQRSSHQNETRETALLREMLERERSLNRELTAERDRVLTMLEQNTVRLIEGRAAPWWRWGRRRLR
jgi:hypothetical protein